MIMSIENAKAFYQRMTEDRDFRSPFESASTKEERQQLIKDAGYDFTADEWQAAMTEIQATDSNEELQEEELEAIAGGIRAGTIYGVIWPTDDVTDWFK
jgi:predicted ribosomally synthesized peptide with nif11-like leader